jgi:pimeloyl-ACP methyl ester carboxylesterase
MSMRRSRLLGVALLCPFLWSVRSADAGQALAAAPVDSMVLHVSGGAAPTFVLISGIVGGHAGFRRLREQLLPSGARVVLVDPYRHSIDSANVSFDAMARRVDALLELSGVRGARIVGHAHGGGVALRLAALAPGRAEAIYLLDVGALPESRTKVMSGALRLAPIIGAFPGGKRFIAHRFVKGLRENSGRHDWLDSATQHAYAAPLLAHLGPAVRMAGRLSRAAEP